LWTGPVSEWPTTRQERAVTRSERRRPENGLGIVNWKLEQ
jgi:hypothetical protein